MSKIIDVGKDFYHRLANRDENQGDGKHNALEFRHKFLKHLDNSDIWKTSDGEISLDFSNVTKIGPSFANEAFAYFTKYAKPGVILEKIHIINSTNVQLLIIEEELDTGYRKK
jgi:hypothetical protein